MYLLVLVAVLGLIWSIHFHWKRFRLYQLSRKVPGPLPLPFIGSFYLFFRGDAAVIAKRFMRIYEEYPELSKIWMGPDLLYLITKPEYLEVVLNSPGTFEKSYFYKHTKPMLGDGLLSGPVKVWKRHRKMIAPTFNQKILNEYPRIIGEQCNILIDILSAQSGKGEIDHCRYLTNCALDIVGETIFGVSINAQASNGNYSHTFDRLMEIMFLRVFRVIYKFDFIFRWTQDCKDQRQIIDKIKNVSRDLIRKKKEQLGFQTEIEDGKKKPFLDFVVEKSLNNELSQEELEDEVNTFLLAGTDTNATATSFILTLLGMHHDVQEKVFEEVAEVLGPDRFIELEDLSKLKYTERVIKESLRLFPGAPFVGRIITEDISLGEIVVPKGSNAVLGYLHLHRSEKYWSDPLKFDPDRFLPENSTNRHAYAWLPFSGGPRNCIGIKFGMMVMKILVAMVIRKFKVSSATKSIEDIELTANIVLKPKRGFRLAFELR